MKSYLVILLICLGSIACDTEEKNTQQNIETKPQIPWSKTYYTDEQGKEFMKVVVGEDELHVPKEYVIQNSFDSVFFDMIFMWPGFTPVRDKAHRDKDKQYDGIRIRLNSPLLNTMRMDDSYLYFKRYYKDSKYCQKLIVSKRFPDLLECNETIGARQYYHINDETFKTPSGNPVVASCRYIDKSRDNRMFCRISVKLTKYMEVEYELNNKVVRYGKIALPDPDKHLIENFKSIHTQVMQLVNSFYNKKEQ